MTALTRPKLRRLESFPISEADGEVLFALRDPDGFGRSVVIPYAAAVLTSLMDGQRTLGEIQEEYQRQFGDEVELDDLQRLIGRLDDRYLLDSDRFRAHWKREIETYLNSPVRPAAHAGGAYLADPDELRKQLNQLFTAPEGPGAPSFDEPRRARRKRLRGVLSPHIDFHRGGPTFAWAYKRVIEESDANLFVIFGTAHKWMGNLFSVTRKHFDTPLGLVETDQHFIASLAARLEKTPGGHGLNLFADELAHRHEHSIEFQALMLQHLLLGRRSFTIVPVLTGSFHSFIEEGAQPADSPQVAAFVAAMRSVAAEHGNCVCYISGGDLAHIGQRFGDRALLNRARLDAQADSDLELLAAACRPDAAGFFDHVAAAQDRHRICGLSPTYTMLEVMRPKVGELLKYDQAVEEDGTSCVSFASAAFYK